MFYDHRHVSKIEARKLDDECELDERGWFEWYRGDEDEPRILPAVFSNCGTYRGKGSIVDPAVDSNGITEEDRDRDPGFFEDYKAGMYNVTCPSCKGKGRYWRIDFDTRHLDTDKPGMKARKNLKLWESEINEVIQDSQTMLHEMGIW